jgi:hypothetical protein
MTTYRDLANADAFHRRRLVAAFVSGARAGVRAEPPRAGRCLVGGLVLVAILSCATGTSAATTGVPTVTWDRGMLRISR